MAERFLVVRLVSTDPAKSRIELLGESSEGCSSTHFIGSNSLEHASAAKVRPEFNKVMADAHAGKFDILVVWALDRLGRSMVGNLTTVLKLDSMGVQVISAREPWLDMGGPVRSLLIAVFGWVAEQERVRIVERTRAGLEHARAKGVRLGRPKARVDLDAATRFRDEGLSFRDVARKMKVGASTLHRVLQTGACVPNTVSA